MAIIDLLSILPSINMINKGFKVLKTIRLIRTFHVLRIFKSFRYSKNIQIILQVGKNSKKALIAVLYLAIGYILFVPLLFLMLNQIALILSLMPSIGQRFLLQPLVMAIFIL